MANEVGNKVADMVMDMEDKPGQTRADRDKPGRITICHFFRLENYTPKTA